MNVAKLYEKKNDWRKILPGLVILYVQEKPYFYILLYRRVCMSVKSNYVNRNKIANIAVWEMDLSLFC